MGQLFGKDKKGHEGEKQEGDKIKELESMVKIEEGDAIMEEKSEMSSKKVVSNKEGGSRVQIQGSEVSDEG